MEWQPTETAPKDGSVFLATDGAKVSLCSWRLGYGKNEFVYDDFRNACCSSNLAKMDGTEPTHWMPLPPPPETS